MTATYDFSERYTGNDLPRGSNRQCLLEAIAALAFERAEAENINTLAIRLSTRYPQSGLTIDEICRRIDMAFKGKSESQEPA
jgi:hypothetical protein